MKEHYLVVSGSINDIVLATSHQNSFEEAIKLFISKKKEFSLGLLMSSLKEGEFDDGEELYTKTRVVLERLAINHEFKGYGDQLVFPGVYDN